MIISLHTPKTGGGSFKRLLINHFGKSFKGDYADIPLNKSLEDRTRRATEFDDDMNTFKKSSYKILEIECIHGHFLPYKYKKLLNNKDTLFITWLREPAERLISHYYFWQRAYSENVAPLHKRVIEETWSLEKFCLSEELKNIYKKFLWCFPIENFAFIGVTEHFNEDIVFFSKNYLGNNNTIEAPLININPNKQGMYSEKIDRDLLRAIKEFHAEDYALYNFALRKRKKRTLY